MLKRFDETGKPNLLFVVLNVKKKASGTYSFQEAKRRSNRFWLRCRRTTILLVLLTDKEKNDSYWRPSSHDKLTYRTDDDLSSGTTRFLLVATFSDLPTRSLDFFM